MTQGTEELTTSDRLSIRVNRLALPEGGERKRNLTTTGLGDTVSFCTHTHRKFLRLGTLPRRGCPLRIHILQYTLEQDGKLFCDVIIIHGKPINSCICYQDRMETLCLDVPLLDPTGDFSGPRAPSSFLPVKDVWISYNWFLRQTRHIRV